MDANDRGFAYGDGVFRTMRVRSGRALNWRNHFRLLAEDCARLALDCPPEERLREEIAIASPGEAVVKVIVTRGVSGRGYGPSTERGATRVVAAHPAPPEEGGDDGRRGIRVRRCDLALAIQPRLAGVKSLNRLENVLARAEWSDTAIAEGLLADGEGRLVEATASNVFLESAGALVTPSLSRCGVRGSQRERVLELARGEGLRCEVRDVDFGELRGAGEVFLTNSVRGIRPVVAFGDLAWPAGPLARRLMRLIEEDDAREA